MNNNNLNVLANIIGAVETGGQVYGHRRYNDYTPPYKNTENEHTITLGWAQNYGNEAEKLISLIYHTDTANFLRLDTATPSISSMLGKNWEVMRWNPNESQKKALVDIISSDVGKQCQDYLFINLMEKFISDCNYTYTTDIYAQMMYCEVRHLGGKGAADRIFNRCKKNYSVNNILECLNPKYADLVKYKEPVEHSKFWSRHKKCAEFIKMFAKPEGNTMNNLERAKTLLYQPLNEVMTGYTPTGKQYFVEAGAWYKTPKRGDIVYFYSSSKGRVGHVGIVEEVDEAIKYIYTIEGNTSSTMYNENGGCVARHTYDYRHVGGSYKINGFGRPNFEGVGITVDEFIDAAAKEIGYLEKRSPSNLDNKVLNVGSNNYQKYQRDVGAGNGDYWCQYFVDAVALYACSNKLGNIATGQKWLNDHYADILNTYCGSLLDVDDEYGPKSRWAALAVWKYLTNTSVGVDLNPSNKNFADGCKKYANLVAINRGSKNDFVYICQFILSAKGFYKLELDGIAGNGTIDAIKEFQKSRGLEADGSCGANTWYELFN